MVTQESVDRVRREIETHEHEGWQLQESAQGGWYCAACGQPVTNDDAQKLGKPPLGRRFSERQQGMRDAVGTVRIGPSGLVSVQTSRSTDGENVRIVDPVTGSADFQTEYYVADCPVSRVVPAGYKVFRDTPSTHPATQTDIATENDDS